jgi:3-hydroxybutyrate dehydrogenase
MLEGKSALITGSTSGIGFGIAKALARNGANVVLHGLESESEFEKQLTEIAEISRGKFLYVQADIKDKEQIHKLMERSIEGFGRIDIMVNNAGIQYVCELDSYPEDQWDKIIAVDLSAAFHTTKAVLPGMRKNKWGRIINIASAHGLVASPHKSAYVAAKHGVVGLTKVTALEAALDGITCNAICPGFVWTPLVEKQIADVAHTRNIPKEKVISEVMLSEHATKEFTTVDEIAGLVLFLCSDDAKNMTGTALPIDGGWTAH